MNKFFTILVVLITILSVNFVFAQQGIHTPGTGVANPEIKEEGQGTGQGLQLNMGERLSEGNYVTSNGENLSVRLQDANQIRLRTRDVEAHSFLNITPLMEQNRVRLFTQLSNGSVKEIKIMPDQAATMALERLRYRCNESNNCSIELRTVGLQNQQRVMYEMRSERNASIFGIFRTRMQVQAEVDAENGEIVKEIKPWWSFLATQ